MLSRIAESLFWIGRYVERAEGTARILDVQTQLVLEDPSVQEDTVCRGVLSIMGVPADPHEVIDTAEMMRRLAKDPHSPTSIAACLVAARESARRARETLSTSLWESLNTTYRAIQIDILDATPHRVFTWVRDRAALINGTADSTMMRDESWQFLVLGRSIERADMTSRLVASAAVASADAWTTALRASGGHEGFLRTSQGEVTADAAAAFLLRNRLFPRSVLAALRQAELCLDEIDLSRGQHGEAQRVLGRVRADVEYGTSHDLQALPAEMEQLQRACVQATDAVTHRYFAGVEARLWQGRRGIEVR